MSPLCSFQGSIRVKNPQNITALNQALLDHTLSFAQLLRINQFIYTFSGSATFSFKFGAAIVGGLLTTIGWLLVKGQDILINQIYWYLFALLVLAGLLLLTGWLKIRKQA